MRFRDIPIEKYAALVIVVGGIFVVLRLYLGAIVAAALPFVLAWVMAYAARPLVRFLSRHTHLSRRALSVTVVFLFLALVLGLLFFALRAAAVELIAFGERLTADDGWLFDWQARLDALWSELILRFPFLGSLGVGSGELSGLLSDWLTRAGGTLGEYALRLAGDLVSALPVWLIFVLVTLVASFYFALDLERIQSTAMGLLPTAWQEWVKRLKNSVVFTMFGYLRAYLLLMLITFSVLAVGFLSLRIPYALLLAALFALLDFLPVIGVEALLLPWAAVLLLQGNYYVGIGLLILFAALMLLRQFLEPKIVGHHLGLHPLVALGATYVGLRLFGFVGMLALPVVLLIFKNAMGSRAQEAPLKSS